VPLHSRTFIRWNRDNPTYLALRERLAIEVAYRLPDRVAYWVLIKTGCKHIGDPNHPDEIVPDVTFTEVLSRADR
jgi:hypothetical protein